MFSIATSFLKKTNFKLFFQNYMFHFYLNLDPYSLFGFVRVVIMTVGSSYCRFSLQHLRRQIPTFPSRFTLHVELRKNFYGRNQLMSSTDQIFSFLYFIILKHNNNVKRIMK